MTRETSPSTTTSVQEAARSRALVCLTVLGTLNALMFVSMLVGIEPHPDGSKGPVIATALAMVLAAAVAMKQRLPQAGWWGFATAVLLLPGIGPHKFLTEPAAALLAPVIVVGFAHWLLLVQACLVWTRSAGRLRCEPQAQRLEDAGTSPQASSCTA